MQGPLVSIVIPTYNAEIYIKKCLESVAAQTYANLETLVIDNHSKDRTIEIAREYPCKIHTVRSTWSEALEYGIQNSRGKYYFVMESSLEIFPSFIADCVEKAEGDSGIVGLIGPEFSQGEGFWAKCMKLERLLNVGYETVEAPRFIRRSAYEEIGGYDTNLEFGDDWDFFTRLRRIGMVSRVNTGWIHHEGRPTPYSMMRKKYRYGRTARRYVTKLLASDNPRSSLVQLIPIRTNFIKRPHLLREAGFSVVFGYILLKTVEMMAAGAAVLSSAIDEARGKDIRYGHAQSRPAGK